jgi:hypothetical protein
MVIVELKGGLGNQLFQYAAGIGLSRHLDTTLQVDISNLKSADETLGTYRRYILSHLENAPQVVHESPIIYKSYKGLGKIASFFNSSAFTGFKEKFFHYNEDFWNLKGNICLNGNFQSNRYFEPYKEDILTKIQFSKILLSGKDREVLNNIQKTPSLSIHIRRGDYVSNKIANDVLGVLPVEYYEASYEKICNRVNIENVYIFSDDISWAKANLNFIKNSCFVQSESENSDIVDFYLMQHCTHNIVANSSFSWWAAYLNPNSDKIVVAPKKWFNKAPYDTKDLIPQSWIRI